MIRKQMTNANVEWLFDPGTLMESNGTAYMVLGGGGSGANPGNARKTQLQSSMTSIVGNVTTYNAPYMFEASDIWKWSGTYYLNYTTNWSSGGGYSNIDIVYMTNTTGIMTDFPTTTSAAQRLLPNGSYGDTTNHASLFDFKNQPYLVYHASSTARAAGISRLRVAHLVKIQVDSSSYPLKQIERNGTVRSANNGRPSMGVAGVPQVGDFNPYNVNEAETMALGGGIYTKEDTSASNKISVASIDTGDWLGVYGVNFGLNGGVGPTKFNAKVKVPVTSSGTYTGYIEIRLNPTQTGVSSPADNTVLYGNNGSSTVRTRITGGTVIGRVKIELRNKSDEGKWLDISAPLNVNPMTVSRTPASWQPETYPAGKHDLAFVFYSSTGEYLETHSAAPTPATDGRRRNVGFEIDQWWFE